MRARPRSLPVLLVVLIAVLGLPHGPVTAQAGATRIPLADFPPLPAADAVTVSPEAQALRAELLGPEALQPDRVTLHWYGVASFILTVGGHLLLLDAWEIIGATNDYAPIGREELAALEPEAILIGHGHFDHGADAGYVAGRTGAVIVGSEEICDNAEADASAEGNSITCAITGTAEDPPPGTTQPLRLFADVAPLTVLQHIHSAATPPGDGNEPGPQLPVFDPMPYLTHFADDPEELQRFLESQSDEQGGTWMYHMAVGDFSLLWGDSSGPIFTEEGAAVVEALGTMPGCVDVLSNAILGFDQPVSGLQDPRLYVDEVQPKVYLPQHGDAWAPVISAGQERYIPVWREENEALGIGQPATRFLLDPQDYLRPVVFDVTDPVWRDETPGSRCATQRIDRRWGPTRFGTAARLADARFAPGQDEVWLVPGGSFAEALVAVPAAAPLDAPVLLLDGQAVPAETAAQLSRLRPTTTVVVNGAGAAEAVAGLDGVGDVEVIDQPDPYALAAAVAERSFASAPVAYLTTGEVFADALAAGPAAALEGGPILLTRPDEVVEAARSQLQRLEDADPLTDLRVVIVGGEAAVGAAVEEELSASFQVTRVAGADRFATAAAVAALPLFDAAPTVYVANGEGFADALTAGAPAAVDGSPVLLVTRDALPEVTAGALAARSGASWAVVAGGDAVVGATVRQAVSAALG